MKCKDTRLPLIMAAVLVSRVLGSTAAHAQTTPGAIPDPGTYQGSTQIQLTGDLDCVTGLLRQTGAAARISTTRPESLSGSPGSELFSAL